MLRAAALLLALLCLLAPTSARAQDPGGVITGIQDWFSKLGKPQPPPKPLEDTGAWNTFTLNPLALQHQQLGVEYERAIFRAFSLYVSPEFAYGSAARSWQLSLGGTAGLRFFVLGGAPSGIFFGPEVSVAYERAFRNDELRQALGLGLGGSVGWTLVLFGHFTLSAGFSAQYRAVPDLESPEEGAIRVQLVPFPRLAFGVAF
ncbi:MAG TPA: hypothetical protein VK447_04225 [Myxococcaceae bacterium]|nr:hypothetical protein [Myxococcaceae bacterium]